MAVLHIDCSIAVNLTFFYQQPCAEQQNNHNVDILYLLFYYVNASLPTMKYYACPSDITFILQRQTFEGVMSLWLIYPSLEFQDPHEAKLIGKIRPKLINVYGADMTDFLQPSICLQFYKRKDKFFHKVFSNRCDWARVTSNIDKEDAVSASIPWFWNIQQFILNYFKVIIFFDNAKFEFNRH